MSDFKVSIINGQVSILCGDELEETDIVDLLEFDENCLEDLYRDHAAIQARWEQMAINLRNEYERFTEEFEKKWWAHNKRFAKYLLIGYGEKKPTIDTIKDTVIQACSVDTSEVERDRYATIAYASASLKGKDFESYDLDSFKRIMYKYLNMSPAWYFETLVNTTKHLEKNFLTFQNIAKRLDSRSYHMKDLTSLLQAKHGNMPMSYSEDKQERELMKSMSSHGGK